MNITVHRPESLDELLRGIAAAQPPLFYLAGGTDLMVLAKDGLIPPSTWFDLTAIPELAGIRVEEGRVVIGGATTHHDLMRSEVIRRYAPALVQGCWNIGGPQIRARGTVAGNISNASPAADTVPPLYTLDTVLELTSPRGRRTVALEEYASAPRRTVRQPDEVITSLSFPARDGVEGAFLRLGQRRSQAISKVSVALSAVREGNRFEFLRIAYGAVAPTVLRARRTEALLLERGATPEAVEEACRIVVEEVRPISDIRSTADYRRAMSGVLLRRALEAVLGGKASLN